MQWFKNTKTGLSFEIDNETMKGKRLKYEDLFNRLILDPDFIKTEHPEAEAKKIAIEVAEKKELEELRALQTEAKKVVKAKTVIKK